VTVGKMLRHICCMLQLS